MLGFFLVVWLFVCLFVCFFVDNFVLLLNTGDLNFDRIIRWAERAKDLMSMIENHFSFMQEICSFVIYHYIEGWNPRNFELSSHLFHVPFKRLKKEFWSIQFVSNCLYTNAVCAQDIVTKEMIHLNPYVPYLSTVIIWYFVLTGSTQNRCFVWHAQNLQRTYELDRHVPAKSSQ